MRKQRTIYFNDARHYYLFVFEPPMTMEDAWLPIDEVAGTSVDTFVYGVERSDGLFYPSKVGTMFGDDRNPLTEAYEWRTWKNMKSLMDRGLDPLTVLIDRAHEKKIDFIASLRMGGYAGLKDEHRVPVPEKFASDPNMAGTSLLFKGADHGHQEVRDYNFAVAKELIEDYATDGIELDFIFSTFYFKYEEARDNLPIMTDLVKRISEMARKAGKILGGRVLPTEEMCLNAGLDVRTWLNDGLVDYVAPITYHPFYLDGDMPIEWLIEAAHEADTSVYGFLHPYYDVEDDRRFHDSTHATPEMVRAAAANNFVKGVDGQYAWFLKWPLGDVERGILTEIGDAEQVAKGKKHYFLRRRFEPMAGIGYDGVLPVPMSIGDEVSLPFYVSDDFEKNAERISQVLLKVNVDNMVDDDNVDFLLNGESLANEQRTRSLAKHVAPYQSMWLDFHLENVRPRKGRNELTVRFNGRPEDLQGQIIIDDLEVVVEYG